MASPERQFAARHYPTRGAAKGPPQRQAGFESRKHHPDLWSLCELEILRLIRIGHILVRRLCGVTRCPGLDSILAGHAGLARRRWSDGKCDERGERWRSRSQLIEEIC